MKDSSNPAVASPLQLEFLDLRHFRANDLRALLDEESALWSQRLRWDYRSSANLLLQYVDSHLLVGYVAIDPSREQGKICGYTFCVQEHAKAVIGDVFATRASNAGTPAVEVETRLLDHLLETLCNTPGLQRMEAQLLLHAHGEHRAPFERAGFQLFPRLFLERALDTDPALDPPLFSEIPLLDGGLRMRRWRDTDFEQATHIIAASYAGHIDSEINDQYRSVSGAHRFLHNIVRFPGCGNFEASASWVVVEPESRKLQAILLASLVRPDVGHITQVCVTPDLWGHHIGQSLLEASATSLHQLGCKAVTLTVTEANHTAVELYRKLGYCVRHAFDAMLWTT